MAKEKQKNVLVFADGYPTPDTFDVLYRRYKTKYSNAEKKLRDGEEMYLKSSKKEEFKQLYLAEYNTAKFNKTLKGKTDTQIANWLVEKIVEDQRYHRSYKQAKSYQKAFRMMGNEFDLHNIRGGRHEAEIAKLEDNLETINEAIKNGDEITLRQYISDPKALAQIKENWESLQKSGYTRKNFFGQYIFGS